MALINLRNALMSGKRWKNPYITDGAFFLFDGEWNAGGGTHTTDKTWTDLISGRTISLPSAVAIASNHIEVRAALAFTMAGSAPQSDFSVEYVFSPYDTNTLRECMFESAANNGGFRYKKTGYVSDYWNAVGITKNIWQVVAGDVVSIASTFAYSGGRLYAKDYLNGTLVNEFNFAAASPIAQNGFQVGRVGAAGYTTYQDIYRAAVYSRALTADEIAANYAIDKARFGLP